MNKDFEENGFARFQGFKDVFLPIKLKLFKILKSTFPDIPSMEQYEDFAAFIVEKYETQKKDLLSLYDVLDRVPEMAAACSHPKMLEALNSLGLQTPLLSSYPTWRLDLCNNPHERWFPWHQDRYHDNFSNNSVTVWIPLFDVGPKMKSKSLGIKVGSHKLGVLETGATKFQITDRRFEELPEYELELKFGDFAVINSLVVHRSGVITEKPGMRMSLQFRYDDFDEPSYKKLGWPKNYRIVDAVDHERYGPGIA